MREKIKTHRELKVFQLSFQTGMEIYRITKQFPKEEMYSLTDQIRRSSRSVSGNLAEAFRKRRYPKAFVSKLSDSEMSRIRNRKIGFIFQSFNLIPDLNVFDNVDVPLRYRGLGSKERKERIEKALDVVGLSARIEHLPSQLSGGQQQRVAIARALVGQPRLILADEPTGNLDSQMAGEILQLLQRINDEGSTIVMVTHDSEIASKAARLVRLLDGSVVSSELEHPSHVIEINSSKKASA